MRELGRGRRGAGVVFAIVVVALIAALAVEAYLLLRPKPKVRRPAEARRAMASGPQEVETIGDASAPVHINFYAPLTLAWHQKTIGLLRTYDDAHPGHIYVRLMPMGLAECDEEMGYSCAKVVVNGRTEYTLPDGRAVTLEKKPNEPSSFYNSEDVITVIEGLVEGKL